jgi:hypothetical protein
MDVLQVFELYPEADHVIVMEEDLEVSPDFFTCVQASVGVEKQASAGVENKQVRALRCKLVRALSYKQVRAFETGHRQCGGKVTRAAFLGHALCHRYFGQTLPLLKMDSSLYCISAWNDQVRSAM